MGGINLDLYRVVLLGDSIFDNAAYVEENMDVAAQMRGMGWRVELLARDGAVIDGVYDQLDRLPPDATHLCLSVGGNDLLAQMSILGASVMNVSQALMRLFRSREAVLDRYTDLLDAVQDIGLPTIVCVPYEPRFSGPMEHMTGPAATALSMYNDAFIGAAVTWGFPVVDLRRVVCRSKHYANDIEPSAEGGRAIAAKLSGLVSAAIAGEPVPDINR